MAKSKPTLIVVSHTAASSTPPSSSASSRPRILRAPSQQGSNLIAQSARKPAAGGSSQNDAASSSQVWLTDAKMNERARKLAAAGTNRDPSFQECARKLPAENSDIEDDSKWPNSYRISRANVPHHEKVHSNLRQQLKRKPEDNMEHLDVNTLIWGMFNDCHLTSRSSSWKRLFGEFTFNQKPATKSSETIVRSDKKVGQGSERNPRFFRDQLAATNFAKYNTVD